MKRKLMCLLLCFSLLCFAACDEDGGEISGDASSVALDSTSSTAESQWIEGLDNANGKYAGETISIISSSGSLFYNEDNDPIGRAVTKRNLLLQQYLELNVSCTEKSAEKLAKELEAAIDNGTQYADLICAPISTLSDLAARGLLENIYTLPYLDLDAEYVDGKALKEQTALNTAYMYSGELTGSINACVGLFYNKAAVEAAGVDPSALAKSGNLTWDALTAMVQSVVGNGVSGIDSLLGEEALAAAIYGSSGSGFVGSDGTQVTSVYNEEAGTAAARIIKELFSDPKYSSQYDYTTAAEMFKKGKIAFLLADMSSVSLFDGSGSEWGLIPLPKLGTEQESYASFVGNNALAIAVPRGCKDSGFSAFALNALLAATNGTLNEALKTTYINYHFWSNTAAVMLEVICDTAKFDLGVCYYGQTAVSAVSVTPITRKNGATPAESAVGEFNAFAEKLFH